MAKTVLVFGATGDQGHPLLRRLAEEGFAIRAGTRDPALFPRADFPTVEPVRASFEDTESLVAAATGADAIAMHLPFTFDRAYARSMGEAVAYAAKTAGVGKIVFNTSCFVADRDIGLAAHDGRRDIEAAIEASGIPFAVMRSVVFMDNMLRPWAKPSIVRQSIFAYPCRADLRISWVALEDVAAYMVAALKTDRVSHHKFAIGGPEILVGDEVAARLTQAIGRPITFRSMPPDEFARGMRKLITGEDEPPPPGSMWDRVGDFYRWYNAQESSPLAVDLGPAQALLDVTPTPLVEWARRQDWTE